MKKIVRNCRLCKMPMETSPFSLCPSCLLESGRIQQFLAKHPHVSIEKISLATDVSAVRIKELLNLMKDVK